MTESLTKAEAIERLMNDDVLGDMLAYWEGLEGPTKKEKMKRQFVDYIFSAALEADDTVKEKAQRDAALEITTRIIDILDECDRTVYAQQKWKVAHAGLQGWLFKIQADYPASSPFAKAASVAKESE